MSGGPEQRLHYVEAYKALEKSHNGVRFDSNPMKNIQAKATGATGVDGQQISLNQKTIYIFPGNMKHHGIEDYLFSSKGGGGLAAHAKAFSNAGLPTLSLPTGLKGESITPDQAEAAMRDIWRAAGAGYSFILPVRPKNHAGNYFAGVLEGSELEPSFWGGENNNFDKSVAKIYLDGLNALQTYLTSKDPNDIPEQYRAAFAHGQGDKVAADAIGQLPNFYLSQAPKGPSTTATVAIPAEDKPEYVSVAAQADERSNREEGSDLYAVPDLDTPDNSGVPVPTPLNTKARWQDAGKEISDRQKLANQAVQKYLKGEISSNSPHFDTEFRKSINDELAAEMRDWLTRECADPKRYEQYLRDNIKRELREGNPEKFQQIVAASEKIRTLMPAPDDTNLDAARAAVNNYLAGRIGSSDSHFDAAFRKHKNNFATPPALEDAMAKWLMEREQDPAQYEAYLKNHVDEGLAAGFPHSSTNPFDNYTGDLTKMVFNTVVREAAEARKIATGPLPPPPPPPPPPTLTKPTVATTPASTIDPDASAAVDKYLDGKLSSNDANFDAVVIKNLDDSAKQKLKENLNKTPSTGFEDYLKANASDLVKDSVSDKEWKAIQKETEIRNYLSENPNSDYQKSVQFYYKEILKDDADRNNFIDLLKDKMHQRVQKIDDKSIQTAIAYTPEVTFEEAEIREKTNPPTPAQKVQEREKDNARHRINTHNQVLAYFSDPKSSGVTKDYYKSLGEPTAQERQDLRDGKITKDEVEKKGKARQEAFIKELAHQVIQDREEAAQQKQDKFDAVSESREERRDKRDNSKIQKSQEKKWYRRNKDKDVVDSELEKESWDRKQRDHDRANKNKKEQEDIWNAKVNDAIASAFSKTRPEDHREEEQKRYKKSPIGAVVSAISDRMHQAETGEKVWLAIAMFILLIAALFAFLFKGLGVGCGWLAGKFTDRYDRNHAEKELKKQKTRDLGLLSEPGLDKLAEIVNNSNPEIKKLDSEIKKLEERKEDEGLTPKEQKKLDKLIASRDKKNVELGKKVRNSTPFGEFENEARLVCPRSGKDIDVTTAYREKLTSEQQQEIRHDIQRLAEKNKRIRAGKPKEEGFEDFFGNPNYISNDDLSTEKIQEKIRGFAAKKKVENRAFENPGYEAQKPQGGVSNPMYGQGNDPEYAELGQFRYDRHIYERVPGEEEYDEPNHYALARNERDLYMEVDTEAAARRRRDAENRYLTVEAAKPNPKVAPETNNPFLDPELAVANSEQPSDNPAASKKDPVPNPLVRGRSQSLNLGPRTGDDNTPADRLRRSASLSRVDDNLTEERLAKFREEFKSLAEKEKALQQQPQQDPDDIARAAVEVHNTTNPDMLHAKKQASGSAPPKPKPVPFNSRQDLEDALAMMSLAGDSLSVNAKRQFLEQLKATKDLYDNSSQESGLSLKSEQAEWMKTAFSQDTALFNAIKDFTGITNPQETGHVTVSTINHVFQNALDKGGFKTGAVMPAQWSSAEAIRENYQRLQREADPEAQMRFLSTASLLHEVVKSAGSPLFKDDQEVKEMLSNLQGANQKLTVEVGNLETDAAVTDKKAARAAKIKAGFDGAQEAVEKKKSSQALH